MIQALESEGLSTDKINLKIVMGETVIPFAARCVVQAHQLGLTKLEVELDKSIYFIIKAEANEAFDRASKLRDLMSDNLTSFTELDAADIVTMTKAITKFGDAKSLPQLLISKKKSIGTDPIPALLKKLSLSQKYIGKIIFAYKPSLYPEWRAAIKVITPVGSHHKSLVAFITDADTGAPLEKVKVTATNDITTVVRKSSKKGLLTLYSLASGSWALRCENKAYITVFKNKIKVVDGEVAKLSIALQKVSTSGDTTPASTGYANVYGKMYNTATNDGIGTGLVFFQYVANAEETEDDGTYGKDNTPANCTHMSATAPGFQDWHKDITLEPDTDNEIDIPMDPIDDGPPAPDA